LDRKFNKDSKNVLKTVIFLLQVGFIGNFVPDCRFKLFLALQTVTPVTLLLCCVSGSSNFNTAFLPDCTEFCSIFSGYGIENLMEILTARGFYSQFCP